MSSSAEQEPISTHEDVVGILDELLREVLYEKIAPGAYITLSLYIERKLGLPFAEALIKKPREAYEIILSIYGETLLHMLDKAIMKALRQRGMHVTQGALLKLKEGRSSDLQEICKKLAKTSALMRTP